MRLSGVALAIEVAVHGEGREGRADSPRDVVGDRLCACDLAVGHLG